MRVSFEHRHENKSCSELSNIHTFVVPSFCLTFRHFSYPASETDGAETADGERLKTDDWGPDAAGEKVRNGPVCHRK